MTTIHLANDRMDGTAECGAGTSSSITIEIERVTCSPCLRISRAKHGPFSPSPVDALYHLYASRLQRVYDDRTAGSFSFLGILSEFREEYDQLKNVPHSKECKIYGHDLVIALKMAPCRALSTTKHFEEKS